jgi:phage/plasmid primase-like uncharacterized protein
LHGDGIPAGSFGDWRTGFSQTWRADIGRTLTPAEEAAHRARVEAMRREREAEEAKRRHDAATTAARIWNAAERAPDDHPYLVCKSIKAHGAKVDDGRLVIPLRAGGELHSLQFIGTDGDKRFLTGGRVAGCYFSIGNMKGAAALCIAEGFATAASIHEATGATPATFATLEGDNGPTVANVATVNVATPAKTKIAPSDSRPRRYSYRFRLHAGEGGGLYLTEDANLERVRDCLARRYGDRLALVTRA